MILNQQVRRAIKLLESVIIDHLIKGNGRLTVLELSRLTGLFDIGPHIAADVVAYMARNGVLKVEGGSVYADVAKLQRILNETKIKLPLNHYKKWADDDILILCEMTVAGNHPNIIAKKLKRTENAVGKMITRLKLAYRLIPMIQEHKIIREACEKIKTYSPTDGNNPK